MKLRRVIPFAVCLALVGGVGLVQLRSHLCWTQMNERLAALEAEWNARDFRRPVAYGEAVDGDARPHYDAAVRLAQPLDQKRLVATLPHGDDGKARAGEDLLADWQPALAALHAGAVSSQCIWEPRDFNSHIANLLTARALVNAAVLRARCERLAGASLPAVRDTLDAAMFGADFLRSDLLIEQMIGSAMLVIATKEAWPDRALQQLDEPALAALAQGLQRIDEALPEGADMRGEAIAFGRTLRGQGAAFDASAWRFAFSLHWMMADAFATVCKVNVDACDPAASWPQYERSLPQRRALVQGSANSLVAFGAPSIDNCERTYRGAIAELRLLRIAVALHRGQPAPDLRDPLGAGRLTVASSDAGEQIASAGASRDQPIARTVSR